MPSAYHVHPEFEQKKTIEHFSATIASTANPFASAKEFRHFVPAQPTTHDGSRSICGRYFKASVVIMTPAHAFGALGWQSCGARRSTCDRSRRAEL